MTSTTGRKKKKPEENIVPVLDKGDYNNKKTLCYFLEQEEIAKKMIEEAKQFYNSFLSSKTVSFKQILYDYPHVPLIHVSYKVLYQDLELVQREHGGQCLNYMPQGKDTKLLVYPQFSFDIGASSYGIFIPHFFGTRGNRYSFIYDVKECADAVTENARGSAAKYAKEGFKSPKDVTALYGRWCDFTKKLNDLNSVAQCVCAEMTEAELGKYIVTRSESAYDYNANGTKCKYDNSGKYGGKIGIYPERCKDPERVNNVLAKWFARDTYPLDFEFTAVPPEFADHVKNTVDELNKELREILIGLVNQCKQEPKFMNSRFLFKKTGDPVELITIEIDSTEVDKKKGLYIIKCRKGSEAHPEYNWPSDCDMIKTTFQQTFVFDIASNDLVGYGMSQFTERISRKRY